MPRLSRHYWLSCRLSCQLNPGKPKISSRTKSIQRILALTIIALSSLSSAHAAEGSKLAAIGGSVGGLILGIIQLAVGLSLAAFAINKGLDLLSRLLGGMDIWAAIKEKNVSVSLLAAGVVISYTRVIAGGIDAMTKSLLTLGTGSVFNGAIGLVSGLINLAVAIAVASFAITVVFRVMDKLTKSIDEVAEFKNNNIAIGVVYCGILIGVSGLVASGVSGIGSGISMFLSALVS